MLSQAVALSSFIFFTPLALSEQVEVEKVEEVSDGTEASEIPVEPTADEVAGGDDEVAIDGAEEKPDVALEAAAVTAVAMPEADGENTQSDDESADTSKIEKSTLPTTVDKVHPDFKDRILGSMFQS